MNLITVPTANDKLGLGDSLAVVLDNNNIKEVSVVIGDVKCNFMDIIKKSPSYIKKNHRDDFG